MNATQRLHESCAAVCPILGVSVPTPGNSGSVVVHFDPSASQAQRDAAAAVVASFDWSQSAQDTWERDKEPDLRDLLDAANAAIADINTYLAIADTATNVQVRAEVKAIDQRQKRIIQGLKRIIQRVWRS